MPAPGLARRCHACWVARRLWSGEGGRVSAYVSYTLKRIRSEYFSRLYHNMNAALWRLVVGDAAAGSLVGGLRGVIDYGGVDSDSIAVARLLVSLGLVESRRVCRGRPSRCIVLRGSRLLRLLASLVDPTTAGDALFALALLASITLPTPARSALAAIALERHESYHELVDSAVFNSYPYSEALSEEHRAALEAGLPSTLDLLFFTLGASGLVAYRSRSGYLEPRGEVTLYDPSDPPLYLLSSCSAIALFSLERLLSGCTRERLGIRLDAISPACTPVSEYECFTGSCYCTLIAKWLYERIIGDEVYEEEAKRLLKGIRDPVLSYQSLRRKKA